MSSSKPFKRGNSNKKETAPDGSIDENVFEIEQGVSINFFIKTGKKEKDELGKVFHYDLYGKRDDKYDFLIGNSLSTVPYQEIPNKAPNYFMVQKDFSLESTYNQGIKISELFQLNKVGIVTSRDSFVIDKDKNKLENRIQDFFILSKNDLQRIYLLKENKSWKIDHVKPKVGCFDKKFTQKISYRPFDTQYIYYCADMIERSRIEVMQHFLKGDNLGLVFRKQQPSSLDLYIFCSNKIVADGYIRSDNKGGESIAPLYIYPETAQIQLDKAPIRKPNLDKDIVEQIALNIGLTFTDEKEDIHGTFAPIDLLDYIYAVLHSPKYRETYKEFLKIDFPRVPYPTNTKTFIELIKLGGELRRIHLLESPTVEQYITQYPEDGSNIVEKPIYKHGNVYINDTQYFANVPEVAWTFYIGGYQPAQKWLKDRKDRALDFEDILHYQKIIVALTETNRIMQEIDTVLVEI